MTNPSPTPQWFSTLIREGIASLYLLCLEGCPAADILSATGEFWIRDLWNSRRREWHLEADAPCIQAAFEKLRQTCHRWPAPARFWECLPERKPVEGHSLPGRVISMDERRENMKRLAKMGEELLGIPAKAEDGAA